MTSPATTRPAAIVLPLLRTLAEAGEWRGSLAQLRELLPDEVLPADDARLVASLRQLRPGLAQHGWAMTWPAVGQPMRFVKRGRKPAYSKYRGW